MKKIQKLLALIMVLAMTVTMAAACGNSEKTSDTTDTGSTDTTATTDNTASTDTAEVTEPAEQEDMAEITLMTMSLGPMGEGKNAVEEAINSITEKTINTHVTLTYVEVGSYSQQLNLAITGNEKVDICLTTPIPASCFTALIAQNQLKPLNDLLPQYAPDTLSLVGDYIKGTTVNGNIYAIPNYRDMATSYYILARKDVIDGLGLTDAFNNMASWADYEKILQAIKDKGELTALGNSDNDGNILALPNAFLNADNFADFSIYDNLGDTYKIIATDANGQAYSYFQSENYKALFERVHGWYQNGYIYKDAATTEDGGDALMKSNVVASIIKAGELGVETELKGFTGYDIIAKKLVTPQITTSSTTKFDWAIPVCATEPEAAAKFLNLMYTNKDICNLLAWGVEGRDYVVENGIAKFPEGVDSSNVAYHTSDFLYGNQFLVYPWDGDAADIRDQQKADLASAAISPYLGFTCDTTKIANELTAVSNVISEYKPGIESGTLELKDYDKFVKKLQDSGIDKIVTEYQTQLDAWLASK